MDDLGSVIYVVITIIAIIFSVIKKANKNKPLKPFSDSDGHQGSNEFPDFGTLFKTNEEEEDFDEEPVTTFRGVDLPSKEPIKKEPVFEKTDIQRKMEEMERNVERNAIRKKQKVVVIDEDTEKESSTGWFNAKEAIIYSEILRRPEF